MRPAEYPRLIAIIFSKTFWPKVCGTEQGSDDRLAGRGESVLQGSKKPTWALIAKAFVDPDWTDHGVELQNPNDHLDATDVGEHANVELDRLRESISTLDREAYRKPAIRWRNMWKNDDGDDDVIAAGVRIAGWWKILRKDPRAARARENRSGSAGMHSWRFCGNKLTNQLMMDWLELRDAGETNCFSSQYLNVELDEGSGAGFNTLPDNDLVSTDSDDEDDDSTPAGRRATAKRKVSGESGQVKSNKKSTQGVIEANALSLVEVGK
ncbi:unnamed protein product [Laminaria digitata]